MVEPDLTLVDQCKKSLDTVSTETIKGQDAEYKTLFKYVRKHISANVYTELVIKNSVGCQCCIYRDIIKNEIYVSFRGSDMPNDLVTNLWSKRIPLKVDGLIDEPDVTVHSGYLENTIYNNIHLQIINLINSITKTYNMKSPNIYLTGHSLGGSSALIFSIILREYKCKLNKDWIINIYSYACPLIGEAKFADYVNKMLDKTFIYVRVITERDLIPRLTLMPNLGGDFRHPGKKTIVIYNETTTKRISTDDIQFQPITLSDLANSIDSHTIMYRNALLI